MLPQWRWVPSRSLSLRLSLAEALSGGLTERILSKVRGPRHHGSTQRDTEPAVAGRASTRRRGWPRR